MARRDREAAAAVAASEAGRVLQAQRSQPELTLEPAPEQSLPETQTQPKLDGERPAARNRNRENAMDEIIARDLREKGLDSTPAPEPEPQAPEPTPPTPEDILKANTPSEVAPAAPEQDPAVETVRAKVDGEEFDVPKAEIDAAGGIHAYQRDKAAENRLKKANEALAQTRQMQAQIAQWVQSQGQAAQPAAPQLSDAQFLQSKVDIIRFGTPEESAVALQEVMARNNPRIDPNQITQMAVQQINKNSALDNFKKEFQDIVANPMLLRLAVSLEGERATSAGQNTDWNTLYRQIGNEVRSVVAGRPSQSTATTAQQIAAPSSDSPSQQPTDKEARKASIVNLPTAAARAALPQESKPESREDILNQMRKTRGIPTG
jgi:hypothetical protein